tara:strand:+ start:70 stop:222 length:153 start_codon:yes stop_codon:yes gene_type:complete
MKDLTIKRVLYKHPNTFIYVIKSNNEIIKRFRTRYEAKKFICKNLEKGAK